MQYCSFWSVSILSTSLASALYSIEITINIKVFRIEALEMLLEQSFVVSDALMCPR